MVDLSSLAHEIGADERTMRRAALQGVVRSVRAGPRRQRVSDDERGYLLGHWPLLSSLRGALRTEPNVRLAVLYGSVARGEDTIESDVDLLVSLVEDRPDTAVKLAVRLGRALGREVDIARLNRVNATAPLLLLQVLNEGRVVLDRDAEWALLLARRTDVTRRAHDSHDTRRRRARASIRELINDAP